MARTLHRLTALQVHRAKQGKHNDGGNLYLYVHAGGSRSWVFRYGPQGKHEHGLGPVHTVSITAARERARACREMLLNSIDPIAERKARKTAAKGTAARTMSFSACADAYFAAHRVGWRSAKHAIAWRNSLVAYAAPTIGSLPVQDVDTALIMKVLEPIWTTKPVTAGRVRQRMESVLDWAKARGYRNGENCARWRGHLDHLLPAQKRLTRVKHYPALPYADVPRFLIELRTRSSLAARVLEFLILTASRSGEGLGATWNEFDFATRMWTIPPKKMKAGREHRVPLSNRALAIVNSMPRNHERVFPLSKVSLFKLLRAINRDDITVHGFRSSFRDWSSECTAYPREVCEMALAHVVKNQVEAAYRRGDLFEKRRQLMADWDQFCAKPQVKGGTVREPRRG